MDRITRCQLSKPTQTTHPVDVGQRTEGAIVAEFLRRGFRVLVPMGQNQRYDLVLDIDGQFVRVQCKTGRLRKGVMNFSTQSVQSNSTGRSARGYRGDADLFAVYCPDTREVYAIPVADAPVGYMNLRVSPPRNGQARGVRWAADYRLPG